MWLFIVRERGWWREASWNRCWEPLLRSSWWSSSLSSISIFNILLGTVYNQCTLHNKHSTGIHNYHHHPSWSLVNAVPRRRTEVLKRDRRATQQVWLPSGACRHKWPHYKQGFLGPIWTSNFTRKRQSSPCASWNLASKAKYLLRQLSSIRLKISCYLVVNLGTRLVCNSRTCDICLQIVSYNFDRKWEPGNTFGHQAV